MNIIEMAEQAGLAYATDSYPDFWQIYMDAGKEQIERFAELVAAHEREECAKVAENFLAALQRDRISIANAIRQRSKA